ncbi:MAG: hypothetical protein ACKVOB_11650 [Sphingomonas sp.]
MPLGITGLDPNLLPPAGNATSARLSIASASAKGGASRAQAVSRVAPTPPTAPAEPNYRGILSAGPVTPPPAVAELIRNDSATRAERPQAPRSSASAGSDSAYRTAQAPAAPADRSFRNSVASAQTQPGPQAARRVEVAASSRPSSVRIERSDADGTRTRAEVQAIAAYSVITAPAARQVEASAARAAPDAAPNNAAQAANRDRLAIG